MKKTSGVIEYRFNKTDTKKEIVKTIRYNNMWQYIIAQIKLNFINPDIIIDHK